jgi:hypothetical protein
MSGSRPLRLVHDHQGLVTHEGGHHADLLAVAARELPCRDARVELEPLREPSPGAAWQASEMAQVVELGGGGQLGQVAGVAAQVGHPVVYLGRPVPDVEPEDRGLSARRAQEAEERPDRRRLAGAVGSQEPERLASATAKLTSTMPRRLP